PRDRRRSMRGVRYPGAGQIRRAGRVVGVAPVAGAPGRPGARRGGPSRPPRGTRGRPRLGGRSGRAGRRRVMRSAHRTAGDGSTEAVRQPAVAGQVYPADPTVLARTVDGLLAAVEVP